jgi:dTDP-4-dehydrorhamnose 3,5-epimerase
MKFESIGIDGAWKVDCEVHEDKRGKFYEWFKRDLILTGTGFDFLASQVNVSTSHRNVLRGVHYSLSKVGQAKWITCSSGSIRDVIVDIRVGSPTFGQWRAIDLTAETPSAILIGEGLGHGFLVLEDDTQVTYLLNSNYSKSEEFEINPFDSTLKIDWGTKKENLILSQKDQVAPSFEEQLNFNKLPIY